MLMETTIAVFQEEIFVIKVTTGELLQKNLDALRQGMSLGEGIYPLVKAHQGLFQQTKVCFQDSKFSWLKPTR